jgi:hypothetical protein
MLRGDLVVHGGRAHDAAHTTLDATAQAEQPHHVTRVGVIRQIGVRLVAAHVDLPVRAAMVVDVTEEIALRILIERRPHVPAETPEDHPDVVIAVSLHGQAA